ncbi:MAG: mobile mystery protein A [Alphaproteobacteria bacterium]|nr:mobile mystery protein A [Alphaproteobacteria bacterium]
MSAGKISQALARKHLDEAIIPFREASAYPRPPKGWVRAIRDALGMTSRQLAARMGLSQSTIAGLEQGEEAETVTLRTLRQAAEALDCRLVYALVPKTTLDDRVRRRARALAETQLARIHHTMRLENQALRKDELSAELERLTNSILNGRPSRLWDST